MSDGERVSVNVLRTPDAAFAAISDFPFAPHYCEITDSKTGTSLRIHYIDEGPRDAPVVLMMHGEPTWCGQAGGEIGLLLCRPCRLDAPMARGA